MFQQGKVKQHAELQWLLSTITPMGKIKPNDDSSRKKIRREARIKRCWVYTHIPF